MTPAQITVHDRALSDYAHEAMLAECEAREPWPFDPYEEWLELREYAAAYYGVPAESLTDNNVQAFARLTGTVVRR